MNLELILILAGLLFPAVILGLLVRLPPIRRFSQRSKGNRLITVLGNGLLCWIISTEILMGLAASFMFGMALFYFNTTFGLLPGMTRAVVQPYRTGVILELWSRQLQSVQGCFNSNPTICQLTDQVMKLSPSGNSSIFLILGFLALVPTLINMLLSRYLTRPQSNKP
jgi:hypothetical protein